MKDKGNFERLMAKSGCTKRATEELWKWYDPAKKKGVASFYVGIFKPKPSVGNPASFCDKQICPSKTCGKTRIIGGLVAKIMGS
jgi:hypothetical protein